MELEDSKSYLQKTSDVELFDRIEPDSEGKIESCERIADAVIALERDGVVRIRTGWTGKSIEKIREVARECVYAGDKTDTVIVDDTGKKHIIFAKGRQDTWNTERIQWDFPKRITEILNRVLKVDYKMGSKGVLTLDANTNHTGKWHRDVVPLFKIGSAKANDDFTILMPDFYFTVFIPLTKCTKENGATEMLLGSHVGDSGKVAVAECEPGDVIIMNGKLIHRGMPNTTNENRDVAYVICCAKWYDEEQL